MLLNHREWQRTSPSKLEPLIILKALKIPIPPQHLLINQLNYRPSPDRQKHEPSYTNVIKQSSWYSQAPTCLWRKALINYQNIWRSIFFFIIEEVKLWFICITKMKCHTSKNYLQTHSAPLSSRTSSNTLGLFENESISNDWSLKCVKIQTLNISSGLCHQVTGLTCIIRAWIFRILPYGISWVYFYGIKKQGT